MGISVGSFLSTSFGFRLSCSFFDWAMTILSGFQMDFVVVAKKPDKGGGVDLPSKLREKHSGAPDQKKMARMEAGPKVG